jgi:peptidoglycan/LPS O-acetylase OafA/YrhL
LIKTEWLYGGLAVGGIVIASLTYRLSNFRLALYGYTVIALFYACFLLLALTPKGPIAALTRMGWLRRLGVLAYGLYLFHMAIQGFLYGAVFGTEPLLHSLSGAAVTSLSFILTLVAAELSWRFFEKRFVEIGHRRKYVGAGEDPCFSGHSSDRVKMN